MDLDDGPASVAESTSSSSRVGFESKSSQAAASRTELNRKLCRRVGLFLVWVCDKSYGRWQLDRGRSAWEVGLEIWFPTARGWRWMDVDTCAWACARKQLRAHPLQSSPVQSSQLQFNTRTVVPIDSDHPRCNKRKPRHEHCSAT